MGKKNLAQIAERSGVSKSTVSRVLNNCPGVDGELREAVINAVRSEYAATAQTETPAEICMILPDNPKFFWDRIRDALKENTQGLRIRTYVYSSLEKSEVLCDYFERIEHSDVKAIVFVGHAEGEAHACLTGLAQSRFLIRLCEYEPMTNAFFVGADAYDDGVRLGKALLQSKSSEDRGCVVVVGQRRGYNCRLREQGFLSAVKDATRVVSIEAPDDLKLWPSQLARALSAIPDRISCVFCSDGMTASSCEGIRKLHYATPIRYFGFEDPPSAKRFWESGDIGALMVQDPAAQTRVALSLCKTYLEKHVYPDQKMIYVPSVLKKQL